MRVIAGFRDVDLLRPSVSTLRTKTIAVSAYINVGNFGDFLYRYNEPLVSFSEDCD